MSVLEKIDDPKELKKLKYGELNILAREIRELIIKTVAETGGHLAPSLGTVELTLALHYFYHSPKDKIIWDVGHQTYAHKIITGRRDKFCTLRQLGGISGFPKRAESVHDIANTGHTSTSISLALGLVQARDFQGAKDSIVAVIGDGALTGGMAFEALNHAGHLGSNLTVVLNDNEMSISPNVGALSKYLSTLRVDPTLHRVKDDVEFLLSKLPAIGDRVVRTIERLKDSLKYFMMSGIFFEELGFTYLGPIDGHNIQHICETLRGAEQVKGPKLVHVITKKGKGYTPAEEHPDTFHGTGPFVIETGRSLKKASPPTYTQVFSDTVIKIAEEDPQIIAITAAMPTGTGLDKFAQRYPHRFFDVGIAEQHAVTFSSGLALGQMKPVVAIYSTFLQRAYDQIVHDICMPNLSVVLAIDRGGIVGADGETHHGVFDFSYLRAMPNMTIMAPADENQLQHMLYTAINHPGPVAVRYPRGAGVGVALDSDYQILPIGQGRLLSTGEDVTLLAIGNMVSVALEAAQLLAEEGVRATVIDGCFVKPLDEELILKWAKKTEHLIIVEEHVQCGGFGSAVLELLAEQELAQIKVKLIALPDQFIGHGQQSLLREKWGLSADNIAKQALKILNNAFV